MDQNPRPHSALALMRAGLTRRQMLRVIGVSGATLGVTGLLAACADDGADETESSLASEDNNETGAAGDDEDDEVADGADDDVEESTGADETPVNEGAGERPSLTIGIHGMPDTFDPNASVALVGFLTQYSVFEMLIRRDWLDSDPVGYGNNLVPGLAEDWEFLDDTTLELRLREGVVWHNGDDFDADDVVFTFERILDEEIPELESARGDLASVTEIEKVDDFTVRLRTDAPDPLLQMRLAVRVSWIIPRDYYQEVGMDEFGMNPVGTGPYKVVEFRPDDEIVMEAHDDYWMHRPVTSGVHMRLIPEVAARVSALVSGEVDIATNIPPDQMQTIEDADGVYAKGVESLNMHMIRFNTHHDHLADKRVRQALCLAIDRQLLVDTLWFGDARVPAGHQFIDFPEHLTYDEFELPYDPDQAQELLEEAGYNGELITFRVHPNYYVGYPDAAQAIIEMWSEVGINAELILTETPWDADEESMAHNWSNSSHMADPAGSQWTNWGIGSPSQANFWDPPEEYNELGQEQAATLDEERRSEIWRRMNEIWMDERPGTPLYNWLEIYGIREGIEYQPYGVMYMDFRDYNLKFTDED